MAGDVKRLYLTLSSTSSFNTGEVNLQIDLVILDLSMGAKAELCQVKKVSGHLRFGAIALIDAHTINEADATSGDSIHNYRYRRN